MLTRTLIPAIFLFASLLCHAADETPASKEKSNTASTAKEKANKKKGSSYTFNIDNTINKNTIVDSVYIVLDKFDRSGAGIVKKVFYPDINNHIVIEDLPPGRYFAEVYVLGLYKKHFSSVIRAVKSSNKNKAKLKLDYTDVYVKDNVYIPEENTKLFAFYKN